MCGPHRQSTHHSRAVAGVELTSLHQLHRLWEGLRLCGQRDAVEAAEALRSPGEDHRPYPLYLPGHELQDRSRRPAVRKLRGQDCSPSRVPAVTISLPSGHRLDHEDHHNRQEQRDIVDTLDAAGWPQLCWWPGAPVTQPPTDAGQDHLPGDHISWDWTQDQQEENRADED